MLKPTLKTNNQVIKIISPENDLSINLNLNYLKSNLERKDNVTSINIDRAVTGKFVVSNTKTYTQNSVKKHDLTGNKEVSVRKVFIAEREDNLFDITVREINIYYRKGKKHHFNKVIRFKSTVGTIEYVFEKLRNQNKQKDISFQTSYLLN